MSPVHAQTLARYNSWMNRKIFDLCGQLTDETRKRDVGAFFRSIHGTLNHLLVGDRLWLGRFLGEPYIPESLAKELYSDFDELREERQRTDRAITAWTETLTPSILGCELNFTSIVGNRRLSFPLWFAAASFFNHQTHHRGQISTLLFQAGVDPGVTDLIWLPPS